MKNENQKHDNSKNGWIGVDLDGTLAFYNGWKSMTHIGSPIPNMVRRVKLWIADGWEVRIFTARVADTLHNHEIRKAIEDWCEKHIGVRLPITNEKDMQMFSLWDDRCVQVYSNTGNRADGGE